MKKTDNYEYQSPKTIYSTERNGNTHAAPVHRVYSLNDDHPNQELLAQPPPYQSQYPNEFIPTNINFRPLERKEENYLKYCVGWLSND